MRSHGAVETTLEDKTFLFWKPISFKSHETRMLSGGICFGLRSKDDLNFALKTTLCVGCCSSLSSGTTVVMCLNLHIEVSMKLTGTLARSAQVARQLGRDVLF